MTWSQGIDFRATAGFVTDPAQYAPETGTTVNYPRTPSAGNSTAVGWVSITGGISSRDRSSSIDPRLAGAQLASGAGNTATYQIDLPAAGTYGIRLAAGDASFSQNVGSCDILDNGTVVASPWSAFGNLAAGSFIDASGTALTAANWPGSNTEITVAFSSTKAQFRFTRGSNSSWYVTEIFIEQLGGGGTNVALVAGAMSAGSASFFPTLSLGLTAGTIAAGAGTIGKQVSLALSPGASSAAAAAFRSSDSKSLASGAIAAVAAALVPSASIGLAAAAITAAAEPFSFSGGQNVALTAAAISAAVSALTPSPAVALGSVAIVAGVEPLAAALGVTLSAGTAVFAAAAFAGKVDAPLSGAAILSAAEPFSFSGGTNIALAPGIVIADVERFGLPDSAVLAAGVMTAAAAGVTTIIVLPVGGGHLLVSPGGRRRALIAPGRRRILGR
jgi:hypothetical protein